MRGAGPRMQVWPETQGAWPETQGRGLRRRGGAWAADQAESPECQGLNQGGTRE